MDELRGKLGSGVVVLGSAAEGRVSLIAGVTKDLTGRVQAGKVVSAMAAMVGGQGRRAAGPGGGRWDRCRGAGCGFGEGAGDCGGVAGIDGWMGRRVALWLAEGYG